VFELQDKLASSVVGVIEPALQSAEIRRSTERPANDLTTYDLYLRALSDFPTCDRDRLTCGLAWLEEAIVRDPNYGPALALAAAYRIELENHGWIADSEQTARLPSNFRGEPFAPVPTIRGSSAVLRWRSVVSATTSTPRLR